MGYHDGLAGNDHISEDEYETKFGYESFIIGYDQGYDVVRHIKGVFNLHFK